MWNSSSIEVLLQKPEEEPNMEKTKEEERRFGKCRFEEEQRKRKMIWRREETEEDDLVGEKEK